MFNRVDNNPYPLLQHPATIKWKCDDNKVPGAALSIKYDNKVANKV